MPFPGIKRPSFSKKVEAFSKSPSSSSSILPFPGIKRPSFSKKVEAFSKSLSSSSPIMDDAGLPSIFLLVNHYCDYCDSAYFSIVELETPSLKLDSSNLKVIETTEVVERQNTIRFLEIPRDRPSFTFLFSSPRSSTEDLYMVVPGRGLKPLPGFKFNFTTESFLPIKPPLPSGANGHVVNLGGRIYFLAHDWYIDNKHNVFQFYDPDENSWNSLEPFPEDRARVGPIVATAVWCDTILFNLDFRSIWAYDVIGNKWYLVDVESTRAFHIVGEAVVVGDTIYALTTDNEIVLELSIHKQRIDGDLVFKCSLGTENLVRDVKPFRYSCGYSTRHLLHLGENNSCLVQSCSESPTTVDGYQDLLLTYIKLRGRRSEIVADFIHHVKLPPDVIKFEVRLCFSLPKCKTPVLKDGKIFEVDRFPDENESTPVQAEAEKDLKLDNDSSQANITDKPGEDQKTAVLEEEEHDSFFESVQEELKIRESVEAGLGSALVRWKQASEQRKSEGAGVLEEDHVLLFESGFEKLKIQKSVETDCDVNEMIKKLKLQLQAVAEAEAAQIEQAELFKRELNRLKKEIEARAGVAKSELDTLKKELEARAEVVDTLEKELEARDEVVNTLEKEKEALNLHFKQWNNFASVHSPLNKGKFLDRSLSTGGDGDLGRKANRNFPKKFAYSLKTPGRSVV